MEKKLSETQAFVEATPFEYLSLWRDNHYKKELSKDKYQPVEWIEEQGGYRLTLGHLGLSIKDFKKNNLMPVVFSIRFAKIDGVNICFYYATSQCVDWRMIEEWIKEKYPNAKKTDASNFHNAF